MNFDHGMNMEYMILLLSVNVQVIFSARLRDIQFEDTGKIE